ncbi:MAG: hypothetical protein MJB14_03305 [Spirochaetes bacterium]|nr:hypothetical protein [Spirochaetota bacterium]
MNNNKRENQHLCFQIAQAYSLATVVFVVTMITISISFGFLALSLYQKSTNEDIQQVKSFQPLFEILDKIIEEFDNLTQMSENITSPYDGWFFDLPREIEDYEITYHPVDCFLDINHLDFKLISKQLDLSSDLEVPDYFFAESQLAAIPDEQREFFSIYMLPNFNTCDPSRLQEFMKSWNFEESVIQDVVQKINYYRTEDYWKTKKLLIDEEKYKNMNTQFDRNSKDLLYILFDSQGTINLNFVEEKLFQHAFKICHPKGNAGLFWPKIAGKHDSESTIDRLQDIFNSQDYKRYEKMFSIDSKLFKITIKKNEHQLETIVRKYQNTRGLVKFHFFRNMTKIIEPEENN